MPTVVVDRPRSPVTETFARPVQRPVQRSVQRPTRFRPSPAPAAHPSPEAVDRDRPACASTPELFRVPILESEPVASAPAPVRRQYAALAAEATEVCASCPLLTACLYRAVVECDVAGFVAGTTERQRAEIRRRLGVRVEPEDFDTLAGVVGGQRTIDHDEVVRLRRLHAGESLERLARRLGCSLSTVKRHLRQERNQPSVAVAPATPRPTTMQVRRVAAETLVQNSGSRRAAA